MKSLLISLAVLSLFVVGAASAAVPLNDGQLDAVSGGYNCECGFGPEVINFNVSGSTLTVTLPLGASWPSMLPTSLPTLPAFASPPPLTIPAF
jgi:hypothetical protein